MLFAAILGNTFSCTKKNLSDSYAANFAAKCHSCNFVAKVQIIPELCKFFAIIFVSGAILLLRDGSYYTYNLFTLDIYISKFQSYRYRELLYIIIYNNLII